MRKQVVPDRDRLGPLQMRVAGHHPIGVGLGLDGERVDDARDQTHRLRRDSPAVKAQIECNLVIARTASVKRGAGRRQLGQAPLDGSVDVLVSGLKLELARIELFLDAVQAALDGRQLRRGKKTGRSQSSRVGNAACDVVAIELEVRLDRARKALEHGMHTPAEARAPELARRFPGYGVSLFTSPRSPFSSRSCKRPWTWAAVRTPKPQSLMKPAAADWSNVSPLP